METRRCLIIARIVFRAIINKKVIRHLRGKKPRRGCASADLLVTIFQNANEKKCFLCARNHAYGKLIALSQSTTLLTFLLFIWFPVSSFRYINVLIVTRTQSAFKLIEETRKNAKNLYVAKICSSIYSFFYLVDPKKMAIKSEKVE